MKVTPIQAEHLDEVGRFLHQHLAKRIPPEAWVRSLTHRWAADQPNFGIQLRTDDGRLVGAICAAYSDQTIDGRVERFCNPHSWCVLDECRHASLGLVVPLVRQPGYHFTMFTPNPKVAQVFLGLRFKLLDDTLLYFPNLPSLRAFGGGRFVESRREQIAARLDGVARREFEAHAGIPWLEFVAFGVPGDACLAIYKRGRWKRMACAGLMHVSDPAAMQRHGHLLRHHLLLARGIPVTRVEARFLAAAPPLALRTKRLQPKLALTKTLADGQVRDVYSELMALDI